jgi:ABC-2 type transport system permease protein
VLTCVSFALFGFIIGIWAQNFEQLQLVPLAGGHAARVPGRGVLFDFDAAAGWQTVSLFNPVVYLISGFRWSFFGLADVPVGWSLLAIGVFLGCASLRWRGSSAAVGV